MPHLCPKEEFVQGILQSKQKTLQSEDKHVHNEGGRQLGCWRGTTDSDSCSWPNHYIKRNGHLFNIQQLYGCIAIHTQVKVLEREKSFPMVLTVMLFGPVPLVLKSPNMVDWSR